MSSPQAAQSLHSNIIQGRDITLNNNAINCYNQHISAQRDPTDVLKEHVAFGALHDSAERFNPPKCHPETRTAVLDLINLWAQDSLSSKPIIWLSGAAGAGKSAIAQTLAERWKQEKLLAASFFFWRTDPKRNQKTHLIPTIAFQLANLIPTMRPPIEGALCGGVFEKNLNSQMEDLVVQPIETNATASKPTIVIVIDGLDECCVGLPGQDYEAQQREILETIESACQHTQSLRILVASRPERQIRECFERGYLKQNTTHINLNNSPNIHADIRLFLDCKFHEIRQSSPSLDSSWPTEKQLLFLVAKSSGQFIYPSTVIRYISRPRGNPKRALEKVLALRCGSDSRETDTPFSELDALYTLVLQSVSSTSLPVVMDILGHFCCPFIEFSELAFGLNDIFLPTPTSDSCRFFELFLFTPLDDINIHLTDLHSIMEIPPPEHDDRRIRPMHATFTEFLRDQVRSQRFFVDHKQYLIRCHLLFLRHVQRCFVEQTVAYDTFMLATAATWHLDHDDCTPSKPLMSALWDLMSFDIGPYPKLSTWLSRKPDPKIGLVHVSIQFVQLLDLRAKLRVLIYLEKCNVPEIEPSWSRRFFVRRALKKALVKVMCGCERDEQARKLDAA